MSSVVKKVCKLFALEMVEGKMDTKVLENMAFDNSCRFSNSISAVSDEKLKLKWFLNQFQHLIKLIPQILHIFQMMMKN